MNNQFSQLLGMLMGNSSSSLPTTEQTLDTASIPTLPGTSSSSSTSTTTVPTTTFSSTTSASSVPINIEFSVDDAGDDNSDDGDDDSDENGDDDSDDGQNSSDNTEDDSDDSLCICEYCGDSFASIKNLQRHIAKSCKKKPVPSASGVNNPLMNKFVPFTFTSKYGTLKWKEQSLLSELVGVWAQYVVCDAPNYFKNVLEKNLHCKVPHCEPLSVDTMKTYKSNLARLLYWLECSFPSISNDIKILELLFNWDILNMLISKFQQLVMWQTKTFQNCCSSLRRFLVMFS
jgi:hypothetical protein